MLMLFFIKPTLPWIKIKTNFHDLFQWFPNFFVRGALKFLKTFTDLQKSGMSICENNNS